MTYSIDQLSQMTGTSVRTIRFYIQTGLVSRPEGTKRGSHYTDEHLEELLRVKRLVAEGRSLESIKALSDNGEEDSCRTPKPGTISVRSHVHLAPGVELVIDPQGTSLSGDDLRALASEIISFINKKSGK